MPLPLGQTTKLRTPDADQLREVCAAQAARRSEQFGQQPIRSCSGDWARLGSSWRIAYVWLVPLPGDTGNYGFRVTLDKHGTCTVEAWSPEGDSSQVTLRTAGTATAVQLTKALNVVFGAASAN